jgi:hypothetical protein
VERELTSPRTQWARIVFGALEVVARWVRGARSRSRSGSALACAATFELPKASRQRDSHDGRPYFCQAARFGLPPRMPVAENISPSPRPTGRRRQAVPAEGHHAGTAPRSAPCIRLDRQPWRGTARFDSTFTTELSPPNGLGFASLASGSAFHSPSATIRYSYTPGGKVNSFIQRPSPSATIGVASGRQSLKVPATQTAVALGSVYSRWTDAVDAPFRLNGFDLFLLISNT